MDRGQQVLVYVLVVHGHWIPSDVANGFGSNLFFDKLLVQEALICVVKSEVSSDGTDSYLGSSRVISHAQYVALNTLNF